ncbi:54S ribosomal protein L38, mitochondrial [Elasticomyces elasticus]|nr:54S ribosomal protein L38, mitochondrial [Elasticomyces elasticus]
MQQLESNEGRQTTKLLKMIQLKVDDNAQCDGERWLMFGEQTMMNVIDNSGAAVAECVKVLKMDRHAKIGDRIIVVIQKQRSFGPESGGGGSVSVSAANKVRRGDIRHAVVVRTKKKYQRPDGSVVGFEDNACVLINKGGEPIGSRLSGVVGREVRERGWSKILSLAPMHL